MIDKSHDHDITKFYIKIYNYNNIILLININ